MQRLGQNLHRLNTHKRHPIPRTMSFVRIWEKIDRIITIPHWVPLKHSSHDDVTTWKCFTHYCPIVWESIRVTVGFATQRASITELCYFFWCKPGEVLNKQSSCRWSETPRRSCEIPVMAQGNFMTSLLKIIHEFSYILNSYDNKPALVKVLRKNTRWIIAFSTHSEPHLALSLRKMEWSVSRILLIRC